MCAENEWRTGVLPLYMTRDVDGRGRPSSIALPRAYPAKSFTNSTKLRTAIPDGPLAIQGLLPSTGNFGAFSVRSVYA